MSGRQVFALSFGWLMNTRKENEYITKLVFLLLIWCVWWTQSHWNLDVVGNFQDYRYRYCMDAVYSLFYGSPTGFQMTGNGRTLLGRKPTPQNTHLHEGRMLRHDSSMVSHASGSQDERMPPMNLQLMRAQVISSGGNKLSLRCCRCSPSRHKTGIQKQNLTYQEKSVFSSILVCERPDFFKTRWWTKNSFWLKLAQGPSEHLDRN